MKRALVRFTKVFATIAALGALGTISFSAEPASAQEVVYPPAEYIATAEPVYYEGHPAYWYNNRWYYRNAGGWNYYHGEPGYLRDWRGRPGWGGGRYYYGGHYGYRAGGFHGRR
jgi:hypothetical protein